MLPAIVMVALTLGVGLFVAYPLLAGVARKRRDGLDADTADLLARRDQLFHDIRETELDYRTGKLADADYEANMAQLKGEAADVLARLDETAARPGGNPPGGKQTAAGAPAGVDVESLISEARRRRAARADSQG